jgi:hypothetical protein
LDQQAIQYNQSCRLNRGQRIKPDCGSDQPEGKSGKPGNKSCRRGPKHEYGNREHLGVVHQTSSAKGKADLAKQALVEPIQSSVHEIAVGPALPDHFLAVGVEGVVDDPFRGIEDVIVLVSEMAKALGDGFEPRSFGLMVERVVGIGAVDDLAEKDKCLVARESVFFQDRLERALFPVMA